MRPEPFLIKKRFQDFDEFSEAARGWDLDICQLDRGKFNADLLQFGLGNVMVIKANFNRRTYQRGEAPKVFRRTSLGDSKAVALGQGSRQNV